MTGDHWYLSIKVGNSEDLYLQSFASFLLMKSTSHVKDSTKYQQF